MTKADLILKLAESGNITKKQAEQILVSLSEAIKESLQKGEKVLLPGVGAFVCTERKARIGRNPRTGAEINIPAKKAAKFSISASLASAIDASTTAKID
jgi:DNA-binding protein HU-beta